MEVCGEIPQEIVVAVDVHPDARGVVAAGGCGPPVLAPHGLGDHAVIAAVGIGLWEDVNVFLVDDFLDRSRCKLLDADGDAGVRPVSIGQLLDKVNQDIRAAPLARMHAAKKVNARAAMAAPLCDLDGMAFAVFPCLVWKVDEADKRVVGRSGCRCECGFYIGDTEIGSGGSNCGAFHAKPFLLLGTF